MAFLSGAGQDIYAQRLKRSASIDRNLKRSRVPSTATSTSSMQPSSSSTHSSSQSSTPARSRLPSAASNLSSSHHPSPGSSVRPAVGGAQASISSSSTTRASTHTGSSGAQPAQRSNHPTPIAATASSSAPTSHDGPRPVHHIASFSDLGGRQRTQTVSTTRLPKQTVFPSSKPSPSTSSSSLGPPRPHTDSQSGSLSDPSSRPRSRLDSSGVRRYGAPMSPQRNGNHSDGGGSSDRNPGPAAHLDVKRLLSKPAGPSRASLYSVTSDSDSPAAELLRAHSPASHSPHALVSSAPWLGFNGRGHLSPSANRASPSRDPSPSRSLSMDKAPRRDQVSPIRSLTPLSPSPSTPKVAISPLTPTTLTGDKERDRERDRERPRVLRKRSRGKADHRDNGAVGGRASASLHTGGTPARRPVTADGRLNSDSSPLSARLTPAGAIARAYKEQETRHENLAAAARGDLATPTESPKPPRARRSSTDMKGSAQPSYTVFGSSAVFTPVSMERQQDYRASPLPLPSATTSTMTESARRSLVRKVSGRFSRQKSISNFTAGLSELPTIQSVKSRSSSSQQSNRPKTSSEPRKSLQERRSTSLLKDTRRKSLRISLDEQPDGPDELGTQKRSAEIKTADSGQGSESSPNSATATGARLWKLVKRLSSSSLHAKYQGRTSESSTPTSPPPVPAIPKDLLQMPIRFNVAYGDEKNTSPVYNASRASQSPQRSPATTNEPRSRRPSTSTGVPKPSPVSGRRSTTTRSSSPSSLFRPPSRSSMSSIADDVPPIPSATVRMLSPRAVKPELAPDDAVEPLVPRSPPSPDMVFSTAGTVNNFVGRRPSAKQQRSTGVLDVNGNKSSLVGVAANPNISTPPPRPMRSPNRVPLASQCPPMFSLCSPLSSPASSSSPATPSQPSSSTRGRQPLSAQSPVWSSPGTVTKRVSHDTPRSPVRAETESVSRLSVSTARPRTSSGVESRSPSGVRVKFREMSNGPPPARTAQEKDRMWDDLLERSDLAGGTLHLGGGALMSDTLRFSTISSASSMST